MTESPEWKLKVFTNPLEILMEAISNLVKEPLKSDDETLYVMHPMVLCLKLVNERQNKATN